MSETGAFPDSVQHDPDSSSSSAGWHPLSAADDQQQQAAPEGMPATVAQSRPESIASGHTPLFPDSPASSRRNSFALEQAEGRTPKSTPAAAAASVSPTSSQLSLSLPAPPHLLHKQDLVDRLESYASHLSSLDTTQQEIPTRIAVPVIRALSSQLEESQQELRTLQRQHNAQISALKGLLDEHAHGIIPQYVERTLIRARAAAQDSSSGPANDDTVRHRPSTSNFQGRRLSSGKRSWVLHLGSHDGTTLTSNPDGPTAASADNTQSIDSALDEAMTDSHFDSAFTPASPAISSHSLSAPKNGRTRQHSSLSARLFGGFGASASSTAPSSSAREDTDKDSLRSTTAQSESATGGGKDEPASSSAAQTADRRQRAASLTDWAGSVLTWRSASNRKHASTPPATAGVLPEQSEESSSPPDTSPSAQDSALPSHLETPRRPRLHSSSSSSSRSTNHGAVLSSSHPTLETTPSLRQQQQQQNAPSSSPRPPSHREFMSSPTPSSSSTPSSAVRALISKKQIEPPALSVPQLSRGSAEASSVANMSLSPTALSPSFGADGEPTEAPLSPRLRPAPDADALPHDVGTAPIAIRSVQPHRSSPSSQPASLPSSMPQSQTKHQATSPIPRPVRPTRSKSSSSQLSKSSSHRGALPRSGSYMSSMMDALNRTVAYVAPPQSAGGASARPQPASMSRRGSAQGDGRIEPTVTLPSLGVTQHGSIFQLAPAKAASSSVVQQAQAIGSATPVGGSTASTSAANAPPLSMELPTIVASEARPPTFASSNSQMRGLDDLVDRYGFLHEANGAKTVRDLRQRQWDASNASGDSSSSAQDGPGEGDAATAAAPQTSVKRLLLQLDDMYESQERTQQATWDAFLKRRKAQLAPTDNSPARKERPGSVAFLGSRSGAAALNDNFKEGEEDMWTENLIGVARMGNSGKEGKSTWKEFKNLVRSGIPVRDRPAIWAELSGANDQREPGYYQGLLRHFNEGEEGHDTLCVKQIDADVGRTFGTNVFFGGDGPGVAKLRRVLLAYSWHNPEVGYCQGMNLIAGSLLLALPTEEDAFWILLCIIERILPSDYFTSTLLVSRADQRVLNDLVARHLPKIAAHLEDVGIELEAVSFGWFLSLFSLPLPIRTLLRVFDIFFVDGAIVLFRVAAALLQYNAEAILACDNASDLYVLLRTMTTSLHDADQLVKIACDDFKVIKTKDVATLRQAYVAELEASMAPVSI